MVGVLLAQQYSSTVQYSTIVNIETSNTTDMTTHSNRSKPIVRKFDKTWIGSMMDWMSVSLDLASVAPPAVVSREPEGLLHQLTRVLRRLVSRVQSFLVAGAQRVEQACVVRHGLQLEW